ncbi:hypothetical protein [Azospirillum largimobile]
MAEMTLSATLRPNRAMQPGSPCVGREGRGGRDTTSEDACP